MTAEAWEHTRKFAEYIGGKQTAEIQREVRNRENELAADLDAIFERLYEDSALGRSPQKFQTLPASYTAEQEELK